MTWRWSDCRVLDSRGGLELMVNSLMKASGGQFQSQHTCIVRHADATLVAHQYNEASNQI